MQAVTSYLAGLLFGFGLLISGMANPEKVLGFLDLAGNWDPSLALVMAGAISVGIVAFTKAKHMSRSLGGTTMQLPTARNLDRKLILGSIAFGIGWGLAGFCPGPALVATSIGASSGMVFFIAMLAGMYLFEWMNKAKA